MELRHLCCLLGSVTLLFVCSVSASPAVPIAKDPMLQDTCPVILQVGEGYGLAHVTLQDNLKFYLNPNRPRMIMRFLGDDVMYAATVDGTMVKLIRCNLEGTQCVIEEEGGSKDRNFLNTNRWNTIEVNYYNGEITVDINGKSTIMSSQMKTTKGRGSVGGQVTFMVPGGSHDYKATLKMLCNDHEFQPVIQTELPPLTTTTPAPPTQALYPDVPYEGCPVYIVEVNHPSTRAILIDNLTLAVFPTHSNLLLTIYDTSSHNKKYIKVQVNDFTVEIQECEKWQRKECDSKYRIGTVDSVIIPGKWNYVTLSYDGDMVTVDINEKKKLLRTRKPSNYGDHFEVVAEAPRNTDPKLGEHYVAYFNLKCDVVEQQMIWPTPSTPRWETIPSLTTAQVLPTKVPIVEITTEPPTTGISRDVTIVVGVLMGILAIIALVIIISTIKKRRSATINERAPLQNQFQQQQQE